MPWELFVRGSGILVYYYVKRRQCENIGVMESLMVKAHMWRLGARKLVQSVISPLVKIRQAQDLFQGNLSRKVPICLIHLQYNTRQKQQNPSTTQQSRTSPAPLTSNTHDDNNQALSPNLIKPHPFSHPRLLQSNVTLRLTITRPSRHGTPRPGASALGRENPRVPRLCVMHSSRASLPGCV